MELAIIPNGVSRGATRRLDVDDGHHNFVLAVPFTTTSESLLAYLIVNKVWSSSPGSPMCPTCTLILSALHIIQKEKACLSNLAREIHLCACVTAVVEEAKAVPHAMPPQFKVFSPVPVVDEKSILIQEYFGNVASKQPSLSACVVTVKVPNDWKIYDNVYSIAMLLHVHACIWNLGGVS